MDAITIEIANVIGDVYGVEAEDGQKVFELISRAFAEKRAVLLSFKNIEILTTAFLNTAVGQLYRNNSEAFVREHLAVADISNSGKVALKRVVDTAKLYYNDPDALKRSIDNFMNQ